MGRKDLIIKYNPQPPNIGCMECKSKDLKFSNKRKVTCLNCGLTVTFNEYLDYIQEKHGVLDNAH
jgi:hypothetical protein